jgi:GNAT superfamily N-acetyltransferase
MRDVRALTPELVPSAARLLADAFLTNPAHVSIFPDFETRAAQLEWLLRANLRSQLASARSFCLTDAETVLAMGFWTRSVDPGPGPARLVRGGLLAAPLRIGLAGLGRALRVSRQIDHEVRLALEDRPFWYLNNMAVAARLRGRGVGRALLEDELARVRAIDPGLAVALSTQRPENVAFYESLGFEPVRDETLGRGRDAFRNWTMCYAPAD